MSAAEVCSKCDLPMVFVPRGADGDPERFFADCWYCSCCKSRLRTGAMIAASSQERADEMGLSLDEYHEHCASFIDRRPLPPEAVAYMQADVSRRAADWTPSCQHDTNPWLATEAENPPTPKSPDSYAYVCSGFDSRTGTRPAVLRPPTPEGGETS